MKFEANIPSYLRTGAGVFPVKKQAIATSMEQSDTTSENFYEKIARFMSMPTANDNMGTSFAPVGNFESKEPLDAENFLGKMQRNMGTGQGEADFIPESDVISDTLPVMPQINPRRIAPPNEMEAQVDSGDVFIG